MPDKVFLDSNIFVYAALDDGSSSHKHKRAIELIENTEIFLVASTQVVNEFYAVLIKQRIDEIHIREKASEILNDMEIVSITPALLRASWKIKDKYRYSYWDSMIIASALDSECRILYSEDMQHGQIIDKDLIISNPFK